MIRKGKLFNRPKKAYEKSRIAEENLLLEKYGLKTKREIWKTIAKVNYFRTRAKALANSPIEDQEVLFNKLNYLGLKVNSIADVLALKVENLLERRFSTIVAKKGLASTAKQARQMIAHKTVLLNGNAINIPSYLVPVAEEGNITVKQKVKKQAAVESASETTPNA